MPLWSRPSTIAAPRTAPSVALGLERLEVRLTPSLGGEFQVNETFPHDQFDPAVASAANGRRVVVWASAVDADFDDVDIHAQLFDENNDKFGSELTIASTTDREFEPSVAMDAVGNFVVTWTRNLGNAGELDVWYATFSDAGAPLHSGAVADTEGLNESDSSVAAGAAGQFVVAYTTGDFPDQDVRAVRYDADGNRLGDMINVAGRAGVREYVPEVTCAPNGRFAIVLNRNDSEVLLRRYSAAGKLQGSHRLTSSKADDYSTPDVAMYANGACIVVWEWDTNGVGGSGHADVYVRRVSRTGVMSGLITISKSVVDDYDPTVAVDNTTGDYVVAIEQYNPSADLSSVLFCQLTQQSVNIGKFGVVAAWDSDVAGFDDDGFFLLVYEAPNAVDRGDGDGTGVFAQLGSIHGIPT